MYSEQPTMNKAPPNDYSRQQRNFQTPVHSGMEYGLEKKDPPLTPVKMKKDSSHQPEPLTQHQLQHIFQKAGSPPGSPSVSPLLVSAPRRSNGQYPHNFGRSDQTNTPRSLSGSRSRSKNSFSDRSYPSTPEMAR